MMSVGGGSMAGVSEASGGSGVARQVSGSGTSDDDASANGSEVQV